MPRVANPPRANARTTSKHATATPMKSSLKIPLNDDAQEKAIRLQSRQALHDLQMNQLKAAASPMRKLNTYDRAASSSPKTPNQSGGRNKENEGGLHVVPGTSMTPMKRVPILANFEEWMKMATDNKINAANSWNFALIDYFHDMSLLKEGDGVNFQKASCTLDGCVKIYTSRVDSVATETGKLLSGLADGRDRKRKGGDGEEEEGEEGEEDEEEGEDGVKKRTKKRAQRSSEATLAPSFAPLQLKKFELEFSVDPLFKKASADFDEGGAKGLLLNHLAIDSQGRIMFDSSDDAGDATAEGQDARRRSGATEEEEGDPQSTRENTVEAPETKPSNETEEDEADIDIQALGSRFFSNLSILDEQDICPSLKTLELGNPTSSSGIPFLKAPEDWKNDQKDGGLGIGEKSGLFLDDDDPAAFGGDDDDGMLGGFDVPADTGFGEGGDAWARDAALEPGRPGDDDGGGFHGGSDGLDGDNGAVDGGVGGYDPESGDYAVTLQRSGGPQGTHDDILSYFDQALTGKTWAGPEHWRIRRIKDLTNPSTKSLSSTAKPRREKEPFEIDFLSPLDTSLAETIYTPATSTAAISLPKTQRRRKGRNLLPDDKHFSSRQLLQLFLKPRARLGTRRNGFGRPGRGLLPVGGDPPPDAEIDEAYWARSEGPNAPVQGTYDADFFADDHLPFAGGDDMDDDDENFADAREHLSPGPDGPVVMNGIDNVLAGATSSDNAAGIATATGTGGFGNNLVTQTRRLRPEYVQYARVAKKVDVRRLKEEMWRGMGIEKGLSEKGSQDEPQNPTSTSPTTNQPESEPLLFTTLIQNLTTVYPKPAMADISTSYCFICLLHLANEKGLAIEKEQGLMELRIRRDENAEGGEGE